LRGVTLPDEKVLSLLKNKFEVTWRNIERRNYVGNSYGYTCEQTAVGTTNGAGANNVQIIILSPDHRVLHALPGFWHPKDFARELRLSLVLHSLWKSRQSMKAKKDTYRRLQLFALKTHPRETFARSRFQGFAQSTEQKKAMLGPRDTFTKPGGSLKKINQIVHERMSRLPFRTWTQFQMLIPEFADLGKRFYDLNDDVDGRGKPFKIAARNARAKAKDFKEKVAKARRKVGKKSKKRRR
jgi:hypothetical protein